MNEYENVSGASMVSIITVPLTTIILNEIYLTLKNLKGLDLLLYIIGMFGDVYFLSCGKIFFIVLSLAVFQFQSPSICEGDVVDIVFNQPQSDIWI